MSLAKFRRGLLLIPVVLVAAVFLIASGRYLASRRPPDRRPTKTTGSAPISLTTTSSEAKQLRASLKDANVIILVLDAARADHFGCYGYPRETTPNTDRIAGASLVFEQHFSQFPHTRSSTSSLFTGQYPDTHGVIAMEGELSNDFTLEQAMRSAGFETAFISTSVVASPVMGIGDDFDYVSARTRGPGGVGRTGTTRRNPGEVLAELPKWLDERKGKRFYAYIHFLQPHQPYNAPEEMQQLFANSKPPNLWQGGFVYPEIKRAFTKKPKMPARKNANLYDANLRYGDSGVGELEKILAERNLLDNTLLIITSDHGEAFGEHGYLGHREGLYDEHVHIPLVIRFPGGKTPVGRVRALSETVDILPTILDLFALPIPSTVQGKSLLPLIIGERRAVHDFVFARAEGTPESYLVRDQHWAMILFKGGKLQALYDLEKDPWQTRNVIAEQPKEAERIRAAFKQFAQAQRLPPLDFIDPNWKPTQQPSTSRRKLSQEHKRELKALGYVD